MKNIIKIIDVLRGGIKGLAERSITIQNEPYMPLHIENIGQGPDGLPAIAVSHTYVQNGDLMRDPEICFQWVELPATSAQPEAKVILLPYTYRQDGLGINREYRYRTEANVLMADTRGIRGVEQLARTWNKNISEQGFVHEARKLALEEPGGAARAAEEAALYQSELFSFEAEDLGAANSELDSKGIEVESFAGEFDYYEEDCLLEVATGKVTPIDQFKYNGKAILDLTEEERIEVLKTHHLHGDKEREVIGEALTSAYELYPDKEKWAVSGMEAIRESISEYPSLASMPLLDDLRALVERCYPEVAQGTLNTAAYHLDIRRRQHTALASIADGKPFASTSAKAAFKSLQDAGFVPVALKQQVYEKNQIQAILLKKAISTEDMPMKLIQVKDKAGQQFYALYHTQQDGSATIFREVVKELEARKEREAAPQQSMENSEGAVGRGYDDEEEKKQLPVWASDEQWESFFNAIKEHSKEIVVGEFGRRRIGQLKNEDWEFPRTDYLMKYPPTKEVYDRAYQKNEFYLKQHTHPDVLHLNTENFRRYFVRDLVKETTRAVVEKMGLKPWEMTQNEWEAVNDFNGDEFKGRITRILMLEKAHADGEKISLEAIAEHIPSGGDLEMVLKRKILFPNMRYTPYHSESTFMTEAEMVPYLELEKKSMARYKAESKQSDKERQEIDKRKTDEMFRISTSPEALADWEWAPGNRVYIKDKFYGTIQNVAEDGRVSVRVNHHTAKEFEKDLIHVFAPGAVESAKGDSKAYKREDLMPLGSDIPLATLKPIVFKENSTPFEKAAALHRFILDNYVPNVSLLNHTVWFEQTEELATNPARYHAVYEMDNPNGLKIGDIVQTINTDFGNEYGYVRGIRKDSDEKEISVEVVLPGYYYSNYRYSEVRTVELSNINNQVEEIEVKRISRGPGVESLAKPMAAEIRRLHAERAAEAEENKIKTAVEQKMSVAVDVSEQQNEPARQPWEMCRREFEGINPIIKEIEAKKFRTADERDQACRKLLADHVITHDEFRDITGQSNAEVSPIKNLTTGLPVPSKPVESDRLAGQLSNIASWNNFHSLPVFAHITLIKRALEDERVVPLNVLREYVGRTDGTGKNSQTEWAQAAINKLYPEAAQDVSPEVLKDYPQFAAVKPATILEAINAEGWAYSKKHGDKDKAHNEAIKRKDGTKEAVRLQLMEVIDNHIRVSRELAKRVTEADAIQHVAEYLASHIKGEVTGVKISKWFRKVGEPGTPVATLAEGGTPEKIEVRLNDTRTFVFKADDIALVVNNQAVYPPAAIEKRGPFPDIVAKEDERWAVSKTEKKFLYKDLVWERDGVGFEILPPNTAGNPGNSWEAGIRVAAAAQEVRYLESKEKAVKFLDGYDTEAGKARAAEKLAEYRKQHLKEVAEKEQHASKTVDNPHLLQKVAGLPDLEAKYSALQKEVTKIIAAGGVEFPPDMQKAVCGALNSEQGAKVIMKYSDCAGVIAYAGVYLAYQDKPEILQKYPIPEIFTNDVEATKLAERKGKRYMAEDGV
jgi:hypothetical protein